VLRPRIVAAAALGDENMWSEVKTRTPFSFPKVIMVDDQ